MRFSYLAIKMILSIVTLLIVLAGALSDTPRRVLSSNCGKVVVSVQDTDAIRIQAEDYCDMWGIGLEKTLQDSGNHVGFIDRGDWIAWDVNLPSHTVYTVVYGIASPEGRGGLQIETYGGTPVFASLSDFPRTGGWQSWANVSHTVSLPGGLQTIAIKSTSGGWNIKWIEIQPLSLDDRETSIPDGTTTTRQPVADPSNRIPNCDGARHVVIESLQPPTRIRAQDYCDMNGIETNPLKDHCSGSGIFEHHMYVGWIDTDDWIAFPLHLPQSTEYELSFRLASPEGKGGFEIVTFENEQQMDVVGRVSNLPTTGDWYIWYTLKHSMSLPQGKQILMIRAIEEGWNIQWIEIGRKLAEVTQALVREEPIRNSTKKDIGFIHARNIKVVDGNEENLLLRGMGFGGWMLQEPYMMLVANSANNQQSIFRNIQALVGPDRLNQYRVAWLDNWCTEADVKELAASGFNSLRAALHFNLFTLPIEEEPVRGRDTWLQDGFRRLALLLDWCKSAGLYLILDLHAAPGGQGRNTDINDYDPPKPSLFEDPENIRKFIALWVEIAKRYKDEPWIAGYDLLNEPNWNFEPGHPNGCSDVRNAPLKDLYDRTIEAIRAVDKNHMIIIEGNCWSNNHNGLWPFNDDNVVLSFHRYWIENTVGSIQQFLNWRDQYNVPLWMGESGENSDHWYREAVVLLESQNIGWAWWTWKKMESNSGSYSIRAPDGYYQLVNYWANGGSRPDADFSFNVMMQVAENAKIENAIRNSGSIEALTGHVRSCALSQRDYLYYGSGDEITSGEDKSSGKEAPSVDDLEGSGDAGEVINVGISDQMSSASTLNVSRLAAIWPVYIFFALGVHWSLLHSLV